MVLTQSVNIWWYFFNVIAQKQPRRARFGSVPSILSLHVYLLDFSVRNVYQYSDIIKIVITARKRSLGKVMFLHLSVILFTGWGVCIPACNGANTPWADTPPWADSPTGRHPRGRQTPPDRHPTPLDRSPWADNPPGQTTPLGRHTPRRTQPTPDTIGYGQQVGGTHSTGMHTCYFNNFRWRLGNLKF